MNKEKLLKKVCKDYLIGIWRIALSVGKGLQRPEDREKSEAYDERFRGQLLGGLTRELKKAGVLPLIERR